LYLSYAGSRMLHGQVRYGVVSRFVDEIPAELCKWIVVPEKQAAYGNYQSGKQGNFFDNNNGYGGGKSSGGGGSNSSSGGTYTGFKQNYSSHEKTENNYGREGTPDTTRAGFETKRTSTHPFPVGQNVMHAKFGEGVVLNVEGQGAEGRVQIKFRSDGTKWLDLRYAKLTAV
jgi:DNA helicase II / ATP-dependent DNA helicase PcrA